MKTLALRVAVKAKVGLDRLGLTPKADVYVGFSRGWRYPAYLIRVLRSGNRLVLEVPREDLWLVACESRLADLVLRTRVLPVGAAPTAPVVIDRDPLAVSPGCTAPVTLSIDWFSKPSAPRTIFLPYFKHPSMWKFDRDLVRLGRRSRPIRVGFAGTSDEAAYRDAFSFGLLSRSDIFGHLAPRSEVFVARSHADLGEIEASGKSIVLVTVDDSADTIAKHLLQGEEYLAFLATCSFFLAMPGFVMPFTHSLVEAMSVGSIPILNYGDMLRPPLEHGVTCLAFGSLAELDSAIELAQSLSGAELERMKQAVLRYYDEHLSPRGFAKLLTPLLGGPLTLVVNDEGNSVALSNLA